MKRETIATAQGALLPVAQAHPAVSAFATACLALAVGCADEPGPAHELGALTSPLTAADLHADDAAELRTQIAAYKAGYDAGTYGNGTITLTADTIIECGDAGVQGIVLNDVHNLVIRGGRPGPDYVDLRGPACSGGTVSIVGGSNVVVRNLDVYRPLANNTRAIDAFQVSGLTVKTLNVFAEANSGRDASVGIQVQDVSNAVIEGVIMQGIPGIGLVLRNTRDFAVVNSNISNLVNGRPGSDNTGIQIDEDLAGAGPSSNGLIYNNVLFNLPGQGIYVKSGDHIAIRKNKLQHIATGAGCDELDAGLDCGGRGIYLGRGHTFHVACNLVRDVDDHGSGGGINAGNGILDAGQVEGGVDGRVDEVDGAIIEFNRIERAGNSAPLDGGVAQPQLTRDAVSEYIGTDENWNGYGIRVRGNTLVSGNVVNDSARYGVLIVPGASTVTLVNNEVQRSGVNGVKAISGFSGSHGACDNPNLPSGPLTGIDVRDNFIADSTLAAINFEPRSHPDLSKACGRNASYAAQLLNNSLHRNDNGAAGVFLMNYDSPYNPGTFQYNLSYAHAGYNGQSEYLRVQAQLPSGNPGWPISDAGATVSNSFTAWRAGFTPLMEWSPDGTSCELPTP